MNMLFLRQGLRLRNLSSETGVEMDLLTAASQARIRGPDPEKVSGAKRALLAAVGDHRVELFVDLASIVASNSGGGVMGREAFGKNGGSGGGGSGGGGGGGQGGGQGGRGKKGGAVGPKSVSNETLRRTVELYGCKAEIATGGRSLAASPGGAAAIGNGNRVADGERSAGPTAPPADARRQDCYRYQHQQQNQQQQQRTSPRRPAGRAAGRAVGTGGAADRPRLGGDTPRGVLNHNVQGQQQQQQQRKPGGAIKGGDDRGVRLWGPPGAVEGARDAIVALASGRGESEIVLGKGPAASIGEDSWRDIQVRCIGAVSCCSTNR